MKNDLFTIEDTCPVCGEKFLTDGYFWTCQDCRFSPETCACGSDDASLEWTITDFNGEILPDPVWLVECLCDIQTAYFDTPKEALEAWKNGARFTPIPGTDHFEEAW